MFGQYHMCVRFIFRVGIAIIITVMVHIIIFSESEPKALIYRMAQTHPTLVGVD